MLWAIWYHLYNLKNMKNTLLKPATLLKVALLHECFEGFLHFANGTEMLKSSHMLYKL